MHTASNASAWRSSCRLRSHTRTLAARGGADGAGSAATHAAGARPTKGRKAAGSGASLACLTAAAAQHASKNSRSERRVNTCHKMTVRRPPVYTETRVAGAIGRPPSNPLQ